MEKEVLEVVLKRLAKESEVASIIDLEAIPALPKGENYTSTILRVTLKVVLGNGRLAKKSFIMKQILTGGESGDWFKEINVAKAESHVYSVIHKQMTYLMEEFDDTDETLWCNFIHYDPQSSSIVLEDLKVKGYSLVPRQKSLDLDHAILALRGLGRYHGMAKVLEERGIICKDDYKPNSLLNDLKIMRCFLHAGILNTSKVMLQCWGPNWEEIGKKLMIRFEDFYEKYRNLGQYEESEFTVLNHGDCWSNNMMFKYDFQKRPIAVKFLDYQFPNYNSSCVDVTNFMYFGMQPAIRRENYEFLLRTYHDSLIRSLDKFGFTGKRPTLEDISNSMKRLELFGLSIFVTGYAGLISKSTKAFDVEKLLETDGKEGFDEEILKEPGITEKMGPDIIDLVEKYFTNL
ncbi:uncharacterized protein [Halyomorpha halys]|uniref:uncharacterized protein n=1 Tax=Halyomorpha halys TaxID=286706 RepID=UPI0006D4D173|nr:uncharacterized protein LOC106680112 [Halyomorpha halys]XP_014275094.1 uncharacterized protein LOC106680112 [Halyomorpha halys]